MKLPQPQNISITVKVNARQQQRLHEQARKHGYQASAYAQMIFDAAYSARVGQENDYTATDADMDEMLRAVLCLAGQFNTASIARAVGIAEPLVVRILDAWRQHGRVTMPPAPLPLVVRQAHHEGQNRAPGPPHPEPVEGPPAQPEAARRDDVDAGPARNIAYPPEMIETIRRMWAAGDPTSEIAKAIGKTTGALSMFASKNRDVCPSRAKVPA